MNKFLKSFLALVVVLIFWEIAPDIKTISTSLEKLTLDWRYKHAIPLNSPSDKVIFIDIDEVSLDYVKTKSKAWPWNRRVWSDTLGLLVLGAPKGILIDVLLTEPSQASPEFDRELSQMAQRYSNISFSMSFSKSAEIAPKRLPASFQPLDVNIENEKAEASSFGTFSLPFNPLWENAAHVHVVNSTKDLDRVFRSTPMYFSYDGKFYPSPSLKSLQMYYDSPKINRINGYLEIKSPQLSFNIPIDSNDRFQFHFYKGNFETVSFANLYSQSLKKQTGDYNKEKLIQSLRSRFKDKILVIGSSSATLGDLKTTPVDSQFPGALLHVTAISNIIEHHILAKMFPGHSIVFSIILMALIFTILFKARDTIWKFLMPLFLLGFYFWLGVLLFQFEQIEIALATPLIFGFVSYLLGLTLNYESFPILKNNLQHRSAQ